METYDLKREILPWFNNCYRRIVHTDLRYFAGYRMYPIAVVVKDNALIQHRFKPSYFKHGQCLEWSDALANAGLTDWECKDPAYIMAPNKY